MGEGDGVVTYAVLNSTTNQPDLSGLIATVGTDGVVTIVGVGEVIIQATIAAGTNYGAGTAEYTLTINKGTDTRAYTQSTASIAVGGDTNALPTLMGEGDGAVTYAVLNSTTNQPDLSGLIATVGTDGVVTIVGVGEVIIQATIAAGTNYGAGTAEYTLTVNKGTDTRAYTQSTASIAVGGDVSSLPTLTGVGDGAVTYAVLNSTTNQPDLSGLIATVGTDGVVTIVGVGEVIIQATIAAGTNYGAGTAMYTLTVNKGTDTRAYTQSTASIAVGGDVSSLPTLTGVGDGVVTYAVLNSTTNQPDLSGLIATVGTDGVVTIVGVGEVIIQATIAAGTNYGAGTAEYTLTINKGTDTRAYTQSTASIAVGGDTNALPTLMGEGDGVVTYAVLNSTTNQPDLSGLIATVGTDGVVTIVGVGEVIIQATIAAGTNYGAGTAMYTLTINKGTDTRAYTQSTASIAVGGDVSSLPTLTGVGDGAVTYAVLNSTTNQPDLSGLIATVGTDGVVTIVGVGEVIIQATIAAGTNYGAGTAEYTLTINKGTDTRAYTQSTASIAVGGDVSSLPTLTGVGDGAVTYAVLNSTTNQPDLSGLIATVGTDGVVTIVGVGEVIIQATIAAGTNYGAGTAMYTLTVNKGTDTRAYTQSTASIAVGGDVSSLPTLTGVGDGVVTYAVLNSTTNQPDLSGLIATVGTDGVVTIVGVGEVIIQATIAAGTNYGAGTAEYTLTINKGTDTRAYTQSTASIAVGGDTNALPTLMGEGDGVVTYAVLNSTTNQPDLSGLIATVGTDGVVTIVGVGEVIIQATIAAGTNYGAGTAMYTLTINKGTDTRAYTQSTASIAVGGDTNALPTLMGEGDGVVTYAVLNSTTNQPDLSGLIATVGTDGVVTIVGVGEVIIQATIAAGTNYGAGTAEYTLTINKGTDTRAYTQSTASIAVGGDTNALPTLMGEGDGVVTYAVLNSTTNQPDLSGLIATVGTDGVVTIVGVGEVIIQATIAAGTNYGAGTAMYTLTVNKGTDTRAYTQSTASIAVGGDVSSLPTLTGVGDGAVTYAVLNSTTNQPDLSGLIATVGTDGVVTIVGVGEVIIQATIAAGTNYGAGTAEYTLTVTQGTDTRMYSALTASIAVGDDTNTLPTLMGEGDGAITYAVLDSTTMALNTGVTELIATVNAGGDVTIVGVGEVIIQATIAAGTNYGAGTAEYTLTIDPQAPMLADIPELMLTVGEATNLPITFVNSGGSIQDDGCEISSNRDDPNNLLPEGLDIGRFDPDGAGEMKATCQITGIPEEAATSNTYTITATNEGGVDDNPTVTLTVTPGTDTRMYSALTASIAVGDDTNTLPTLEGNGDGAITYAVLDSTTMALNTGVTELIATVNAGGDVTIVGVGEVIIEATIAAGTNYGAGTAMYTLTVNKGTDTRAYTQSTASIAVGGDVSSLPTLTGVGDGAVTYAVLNSTTNQPDLSGLIATVGTDGVVTIVGVGEVIIQATIAAGTNYGAGTAEYTLTVNKGTDTRAYTQSTASIAVGGDVSSLPTLTGVGDGAVTYAVLNSTTNQPDLSGLITTVGTDGVVTIVGVGEVIIQATIAAGTNYGAGTAMYTLTVNKGTDTRAYTQSTASIAVGGDVSSLPTLTGVGDGAVTYAVLNSTTNQPDLSGLIATVGTDGVVTIVGVGEVIIQATIAAGTNYGAGTAMYTLTVNKGTDTRAYTQSTASIAVGGDTNALPTLMGEGDGVVTYAVLDSSSMSMPGITNPIATVNVGGDVTIVGVGEVIIQATIAAGTNYGAGTAMYTLTVTPDAPVLADAADQTFAVGQGSIIPITFINSGGVIQASGCTVSPMLPAGLILANTTDNQNCEITGAPIAEAASGVYTVTATNAGGPSSATVTIVVNPKAPDLAAPNPAMVNGIAGEEISPIIFTNSGGDIMDGAQGCQFTSSSGSSTMLPAGLTLSNTADNQTCQITGTPTTVTPSMQYTITGRNVTGTDTATVTIVVNPALPDLADNTDINSYTVGQGAITAIGFVNSGGDIQANGCTVDVPLPMGLTVANTADNQSCEITGAPVLATPSGVYTITATNAGGSDTDTTVTIVVNKGTDALSFAGVEGTTVEETFSDGATITHVASGSGNGAITYAVLDSTSMMTNSATDSIATVNDPTMAVVTIVGVGEVIIEATIAESDNYLGTTATYTLTINKGTDTRAYTQSTATIAVGGDTSMLPTLEGNGDGAVNYVVLNSAATQLAFTGTATVAINGDVTIEGVGTVIVRATIAEGTNYGAGTAEYTLTVTQGADTRSYSATMASIAVGGDTSVLPTLMGNGDGAITYAVLDSSSMSMPGITDPIATVNAGGDVTIVGVGTVIIQAEIAAGTNYGAGDTTSYTLTVTQGTDTLSFTSVTDDAVTTTFGDVATITHVASGNAGDGTITYAVLDSTSMMTNSATDSIATVDNPTMAVVTIVGVGEVIIEATIAESANYFGTTARYTLTITPAADTLTFGGVTNESAGATVTVSDDGVTASVEYADNLSFTRAATATSERPEIMYASSAPDVATVDAMTGVVMVLTVGSTTITADLAASGNYDVATASYTLNVIPSSFVPVMVKGASPNGETITLWWPVVLGADSYEVYRHTENSENGRTLLTDPAIDATTDPNYDDTGLPGGPYFYWVKACIGETCSDFSAAVAVALALGTEDSPHAVVTVAQLQAIGAASPSESLTTRLAGHYRLERDIDLPEGLNWTPIGDNPNKFTGSFDGQGFEISGLNSSGHQYAGLFGFTNNANIRNIGVLVGNVSSSAPSPSYAGGLVGLVEGGLISNSYAKVTGNISSFSNNTHGSPSRAGGLVGRIYDGGVISNSYAEVTGDISATVFDSSSSAAAGGLVGETEGSISNSYAVVRGNISTSGNFASAAGGLTGNTRTGSQVSNSYAIVTGNISTSYAAGGLVGEASDSSVSNSYAIVRGEISTSASFSYAGGLVGEAFNSSSVSNSYAVVTGGDISSPSSAGGLVGNASGSSSVSNSYYSASRKAGEGEFSNMEGLSKSVEELKAPTDLSGSIYADWTAFYDADSMPAHALITDASASFVDGTDRYVWYFGDEAQLPTLNPSPVAVADTDLPLHRASQHFVATASGAMQVDLSWSSVGDDYMYYEVYRHTADDSGDAMRISSPLSITGRTYMDTDMDLMTGTTYYYWLKACPADAMVSCSDFFTHTQVTTP